MWWVKVEFASLWIKEIVDFVSAIAGKRGFTEDTAVFPGTSLHDTSWCREMFSVQKTQSFLNLFLCSVS